MFRAKVLSLSWIILAKAQKSKNIAPNTFQAKALNPPNPKLSPNSKIYPKKTTQIFAYFYLNPLKCV